jgi:hypothetical protein
VSLDQSSHSLEQQLVSCNLKFQLLCKPKTVKKKIKKSKM